MTKPKASVSDADAAARAAHEEQRRRYNELLPRLGALSPEDSSKIAQRLSGIGTDQRQVADLLGVSSSTSPSPGRGRGRPPKSPDERAENLTIRLYPKQMRELGALLAQDEEPSSAIRRLIDEAYNRRGLADACPASEAESRDILLRVQQLSAMHQERVEELRASMEERRSLLADLASCRAALVAERPLDTGTNAFVFAGIWQLFCEQLALQGRRLH